MLWRHIPRNRRSLVSDSTYGKKTKQKKLQSPPKTLGMTADKVKLWLTRPNQLTRQRQLIRQKPIECFICRDCRPAFHLAKYKAFTSCWKGLLRAEARCKKLGRFTYRWFKKKNYKALGWSYKTIMSLNELEAIKSPQEYGIWDKASISMPVGYFTWLFYYKKTLARLRNLQNIIY